MINLATSPLTSDAKTTGNVNWYSPHQKVEALSKPLEGIIEPAQLEEIYPATPYTSRCAYGLDSITMSIINISLSSGYLGGWITRQRRCISHRIDSDSSRLSLIYRSSQAKDPFISKPGVDMFSQNPEPSMAYRPVFAFIARLAALVFDEVTRFQVLSCLYTWVICCRAGGRSEHER